MLSGSITRSMRGRSAGSARCGFGRSGASAFADVSPVFAAGRSSCPAFASAMAVSMSSSAKAS